MSVDSVHSHRVFAQMHGFDFPLISDFNRDISEAYGVRVDRGTLRGICHRSVFVIDREGQVRWVWKQERGGSLPDNQEILRVIRSLGDGSGNGAGTQP